LADLNGDGFDDVISGSYWPGHLILFEGRGKQTYAKGYELTEADGTKLHAGKPWADDQEPDMDSLAAAPHLVDWDGDGDLDLLVGNIAGRVILIVNEGTAKAPKFGKDRTPVVAGGSIVQVDGDAGPTTADWDGDGKWDLIVGANDGSVMLYRNTGTKAKPSFEAGRALVEKRAEGWEPVPSGREPTRPGLRTKVHVTDYDGDGRLDLLVGDFAQLAQSAPELTAEQIKRRDELRKERDEIGRRIGEAYEQHKSDEAARTAALEPLQKRYSEVYDDLGELEPRAESTGFVWLYRRAPRAKE
jgi:hypothetical protein